MKRILILSFIALLLLAGHGRLAQAPGKRIGRTSE
jgi:hypothetical protein